MLKRQRGAGPEPLCQLSWFYLTNQREQNNLDPQFNKCHLYISLIKPKSQMGISYPHFDSISVCKKTIKFLAVPEVRPNLTSSSAEKTKDFQNL